MSSVVSSGVSSSAAAELKRKIESREVAVGVLGLGYVGLPLALAFAQQRVAVVGFDVDTEKVEALRAGRSYIKHLEGPRLTEATAAGLFRATSDFSELAEPDVLLICVPTPLTPQREPEMSFVVSTVRQIRPRLRRGQLVVLESTTYPGTTDELVRGILEESGLKCGEDFFLAFSPEREDPGNSRYATASIPKVVGGVDRVSGRPGAGRLRPRDRPDRAGVDGEGGGGDQARREHLPRRQHRARQRAEDGFRQDGHRRVGSAGRRLHEALRLHALQPGPGAGGPLHPARPLLPRLEGPRVRSDREVHRARRRDQRADAPLCGREAAVCPERAGQGGQGEPDPDPGTGLQEGRRRRPGEPGVRDHRCASSSRRGRVLSRPPRAAGAADSRLARPGLAVIGDAHAGTARRPGCRRDRDRPFRRRLRPRRSPCARWSSTAAVCTGSRCRTSSRHRLPAILPRERRDKIAGTGLSRQPGARDGGRGIHRLPPGRRPRRARRRGPRARQPRQRPS